MTFKPGQSGNPGGRSPVAAEFRERCRQFMDEIGWAELTRLASVKYGPDHLRALELVAAYAVGKPIARQEVSGPDGGPIATADMTGFSAPELLALRDVATKTLAERQAKAASQNQHGEDV